MVEEVALLQEELDRCKADKEFVWTLWKQMQGTSPALTEAIATAVARERKKYEGSLSQCQSQLLEKDTEIRTYRQILQEKQALIVTYEQRMQMLVEEAEQKASAEQSLCQQHTDEVKKLSVELGQLQSVCTSKDIETKQHLQAVEVLLRKTGVLEEQVKEAAEGKEKLEGDNSQLTKENMELRSTLEDLQRKHSVLTEKCTSATNEKQTLSLKLKKNEQQIAELKETARHREEEDDKLRMELKGAQAQYEGWMSRSALQEATLRVLRIENGQLLSELTALKEKHSELAAKSSEDVEELKSLIQQLEEEKSRTEKGLVELQGKYDVLEQKVAEDEKALDVHLHTHSGSSQEIQVLKELLEKTERELFELKTLMQVKDEEMCQLRRAHEQRLQRMKTLKDGHKLLIQQLKTYEAASPRAKRPLSARSGRRHPGGGLRHENSDGVWNELALCRNKCLELKKDKLMREEEHDLLQSRCLQQQTTIAELRACLQRERDALEKKVAVVRELEERISSTSSLDHDRLMELQKAHLQMKSKNIELHRRCRELEGDCYRLRQEALELQSSMMKQQHQCKAKWLEKLVTKSTMTEGLSRTDSATQVELSPTQSSGFLFRNEVGTQTDLSPLSEEQGLQLPTDSATQVDFDPSTRNTQISSLNSRESMSSLPEIESCVPSDSSQSMGVHCITFNRQRAQQNSKHRRRDISRKRHHSDSEISSFHRQMTDALEGVKNISNATSFEETEEIHAALSPSSSVTTTITHQLTTHSQTSSKADNSHRRMATTDGHTSVRRHKEVRKLRRHPHKCSWQQLLKSSQQRLFTLTKQVCALKTIKHSLAQALQESRANHEKAVKEAKAMGDRLQVAKQAIQELRIEAKTLSAANHDLQSRCSILEGVSMKALTEQQKRSACEAEAKRTHTENQDLSKKCAELGDTLKSTATMLEERTKETVALQEKISHLERDLKNKRQLITDQKRKISSTDQNSMSDKQKMVCLIRQVAELQDTLEKTKQRIHSLKAQKAQYCEDRQKLVERLIICQQQLEQSTKQLAVVQDDYKRKLRQVSELKKSSEQRENQWKQEQLTTMKMLDDRVAEMESQLGEYQDVVIELARVLSSIPIRTHKQHRSTRLRKSASKIQSVTSRTAVSRRAREIARSTFNLSDAEVDALLDSTPSSTSPDHKHDHDATLVSRIHKIVKSQPPHKERLMAEFSPSIHQLALPA